MQGGMNTVNEKTPVRVLVFSLLPGHAAVVVGGGCVCAQVRKWPHKLP